MTRASVSVVELALDAKVHAIALAIALVLAAAVALRLSSQRAHSTKRAELKTPLLRLDVANSKNAVVSKLVVYPIKSCAGVELQSVALSERGLQHDRLFMFVDRAKNYSFLSQRTLPSLALVQPTLSADGKRLTLSASESKVPNAPAPVHIDVVSDIREGEKPDASLVKATVWGDDVMCVDQGDDAARWIRTFVQRVREDSNDESRSTASGGTLSADCDPRLVRIADSFERRIERGFVRGKDAAKHHVSLADGYPILVATEASLADLNARLERNNAEPVTMDRFRPNIVISGLPKNAAWAEDAWLSLEIGPRALRFQLCKDCARCKMPTVDQSRGAFGASNEPLQTLRQFRTKKNADVIFGRNAVNEQKRGEKLSVNDAVFAYVAAL
mmetsp:Transcript_3036/g.8372  ORF Transcript_3036/g.8372 Transcript_3036/m.8372 type:complete len:387 (-) Transcript_3036:708-1868(-)